MAWEDNPETSDIIKWGALALGAWFIYSKIIAPQAAPAGGTYEAPPAPVPDAGGAQTGQSAAPPPPAGSQSGQATPPPPPPVPTPGTAGSSGRAMPAAGSLDSMRIQAANDPTFAASYNANDKLNQHQWNYYREWGGGSIVNNDLSNDPNNKTFAAAEYQQRLAAVVSGSGMLAGIDGRYQVM
jgi:hypothetical protein